MVKKKVEIEVSTSGTGTVSSEFQKLGNHIMNTIAKYVGLVEVAERLASAFMEGVKGALEEERIFKRLENTINITGGSYKKVGGELEKYFKTLERTTIFTDEEAADAFQRLLLITGDYNKAVIGLNIVTNMASSGMFDLDTASRMVAMAMEGNFEVLGRYIPELRRGNEGMLKNASASDKAAYAIKILTEKFQGFNESALTDHVGRINQATKAWKNFWEEAGRYGLEIFDFFSTASSGMAQGMEKSVKNLQKSQGIITEIASDVNKMPEILPGSDPKVLTAYDIWLAKQKEDLAQKIQLAEFQERYGEAIAKSLGVSIAPGKAQPLPITRSLKEVERIGELSFDKLTQGTLEYADKVQNVANQITNIWSNAMQNQWESGQSFFENMARGFEQMLASMVASMMAKTAIWGILSLFTGGTALLGAKNFGSFLFGAQHGADFTVGGSGGPDSKLVAFRASPGERVTVTPPGVTNTSQSMTINFNSPITDKRFIQQEIIPEIKRAVRLGLA